MEGFRVQGLGFMFLLLGRRVLGSHLAAIHWGYFDLATRLVSCIHIHIYIIYNPT